MFLTYDAAQAASNERGKAAAKHSSVGRMRTPTLLRACSACARTATWPCTSVMSSSSRMATWRDACKGRGGSGSEKGEGRRTRAEGECKAPTSLYQWKASPCPTPCPHLQCLCLLLQCPHAAPVRDAELLLELDALLLPGHHGAQPAHAFQQLHLVTQPV